MTTKNTQRLTVEQIKELIIFAKENGAVKFRAEDLEVEFHVMAVTLPQAEPLPKEELKNQLLDQIRQKREKEEKDLFWSA